MGYFVAVFEPVLVYIRDPQRSGLSQRGAERLEEVLVDYLSALPDDFPRDRVPFGPPYFWFELAFADTDGDGRGRLFRFIVSDRAAASGVLLVEYVDCDVAPTPAP